MPTHDLAMVTLYKLVKVTLALGDAKVLEVKESSFTVRIERVNSARALGRVGKMHLHVDNTTEEDAEWSPDPIFQGVVAEDDDFVYMGAGALHTFDDDGCAGAFDVEVHVVPRAERPALVAKLVSDLRKRSKEAEAERDVPRTLYKRASICPFTKKPAYGYFNESGLSVMCPRKTDIIVDET